MALLPAIAGVDVTIARATQDQVHTGPAAAALVAGQVVRWDTNGKIALANAANATNAGNYRGICIETQATANLPTSFVAGEGALVHLGEAVLDALAVGAPVYLNDTNGSLGDAAGTTSVVIGHVYPINVGGRVEKILRLA